jgi:hypothetical protein
MVGKTYILSVSARGYTFTPQIIMVTEDMTDLNLNPVQ